MLLITVTRDIRLYGHIRHSHLLPNCSNALGLSWPGFEHTTLHIRWESIIWLRLLLWLLACICSYFKIHSQDSEVLSINRSKTKTCVTHPRPLAAPPPLPQYIYGVERIIINRIKGRVYANMYFYFSPFYW